MSSYAVEGSAAHELARMALLEGRDAAAYIGRVITYSDAGPRELPPSGADRWMQCPGSVALEALETLDDEGSVDVEVTADMAADVQRYIDAVREYGDGAVLVLVERRVSLEHATAVPGHGGTADCVIVRDDGGAIELQVHDLKFGRGVHVEAIENRQMSLYALGAMEEIRLLGYEPATVRLVIHQPRAPGALGPKEWVTSPVQLRAFAAEAKAAAALALSTRGRSAEELLDAGLLRPSERACRFCPARAACPALGDFARSTALRGMEPAPAPDDLDELAAKYKLIPMIESFCRAVAAKFEAKLLAGAQHPDYKVVRGRKPPRKWIDEAAVLELGKALKIRSLLETKVVLSPTQVEAKLRKANPDAWTQLAALVRQAEGGLTIAPVSDPAPAVEIDRLRGMPAPDEEQEVSPLMDGML